jgi:hypothetical protein
MLRPAGRRDKENQLNTDSSEQIVAENGYYRGASFEIRKAGSARTLPNTVPGVSKMI